MLAEVLRFLSGGFFMGELGKGVKQLAQATITENKRRARPIMAPTIQSVISLTIYIK